MTPESNTCFAFDRKRGQIGKDERKRSGKGAEKERKRSGKGAEKGTFPILFGPIVARRGTGGNRVREEGARVGRVK
jgi:hypothetical protein